MLLDFYAACYERRQVSVSSLCIADAVPATTALRWIKNMTDAGLLDRSCDPNDARRIFIGISEKARFAMDRYFDKLVEGDSRFSCCNSGAAVRRAWRDRWVRPAAGGESRSPRSEEHTSELQSQ